MINLFCGYDRREAIGFHVFVHSVLEHASRPVSITPINAMGGPEHTNAFTYSRFLVPWLCGFKGHAIFADGADMLMQADIAELDALFDPRYAVQVVQHPDYETRHPRKYVGTSMEADNENFPRKNWCSVMLINCEHAAVGRRGPRARRPRADGHRACSNSSAFTIGPLPNEWNRLVDEGQPVEGAKILHWTAGIPGFDNYRDAPGAKLWWDARYSMEVTA